LGVDLDHGAGDPGSTAAPALGQAWGGDQVSERLSKLTSGDARIGGALISGVRFGGVLAVCAGVTLAAAFGAETAPVPNFTPNSATGWLAQDDEFIPPPGGPGPVGSDPARPATIRTRCSGSRT
jgi:hypothetical protein